MGLFTKTGDTSISYSTPELKIDEFIPVVRYKKPSFIKDIPKGIELADEKANLSEYIDKKKRDFEIHQFTTTDKKIKIPFTIRRGASTWDSDGYIEPKLSINDSNIKITSPLKYIVNLNDAPEIEVEIEINKTETIEFYIEFYANDDEDDFNVGEYENILCGRFKVVFKWCVCSDWKTIPPVIPKSKFIGWGHKGIKENCYDYVIEQLRVVGYKVESTDWSKKNITKSDGIYQTFLESDIAGMNKGVQEKEFIDGVNYIKKALENGKPVMVGVDDDYHKYNSDKTTEHFITIVGSGKDNKGRYFLFYDNAIGNQSIGTSSKNKLYCNCEEKKLKGKGDSRISYIGTTSKKEYVVSQIRKTK